VDDVETRIRACWNGTASVAELSEWLDDDREWSFTGPPNFDFETHTTICRVSESAVYALAKAAPDRAPIDWVAAAIVRAHGRIHEIRTYNYTSPYEAPLRWHANTLAPFGRPLWDTLRGLAEHADPDIRRRASEILDDPEIARLAFAGS